MDTEALVSEIQAEAEAKRRSGEIAGDIEAQLEQTFRKFVPGTPSRRLGEGLKGAIEDATRASYISPYADVGSARRGLGPVVVFFKRLVRKATFWYFASFAGQVRHSSQTNLNALRTAADQIESLEQSNIQLKQSLEGLEDIRRGVEAMEKRFETLRLEDRLARFERMLRYQSDKVDELANKDVDGRREVEPVERAEASGPQRDPAGEADRVEREFDYFMFQLAHRGGSAALEEQKRRYLPYFQNVGRVLDLGCGRGEFLEALKEAGIDAYGIEIHPEMVAICREKGLDVQEGDGIEHLRNVESESLGGIFIAQVIEHLKPSQLVELVELSNRVLAKGGVFMAETINPTVLGVFSGAFYADVSHEKPVHPVTIQFLLESAGFSEVKFEWMFPFPDEDRLRRLPEDEPWMGLLNENLEKLNGLLFGPQDYAVVGLKT